MCNSLEKCKIESFIIYREKILSSWRLRKSLIKIRKIRKKWKQNGKYFNKQYQFFSWRLVIGWRNFWNRPKKWVIKFCWKINNFTKFDHKENELRLATFAFDISPKMNRNYRNLKLKIKYFLKILLDN
jgi:hypothetical protein